MTDLFDFEAARQRQRIAPLADRMRPRGLDDFVGQEAILGPGRLLRRAIAADRVGNLILHGPPGVGKTTLARIIAGTTRSHFASLNAVLAGVKELRAEVEAARERLGRHGLRSFLFIDEVHRFNAAQQDALLPWVENGTISLIGATTENPFFEVNKALVSRSRLFRLQPLEPEDLRQLLERALADAEHGYGGREIQIEAAASAHLLDVAGGDARSLLNALELAVETTEPDANGAITIDLAIAEESIQQRAVLYDKQGDAHFDTISAFIKSLRGSDPDAALFWLARMVEAGENPRFIFRRMLIAAGEDVGLADPQAVVVVEACAAAFERVGLPEGLYPLAQAALYLASTEKSNSVLGFFDALKSVRATSRQEVPSHLRDANRDGKAFGDGVGYRYPHAYAEHWVAQQYLPGPLQGEVFWKPGGLGWEGALGAGLQRRRAAQLAAAAEADLEQGILLTTGPEDPALQRWLRRQIGSEGQRLERLRQRFWQGACWQRHDRCLVVNARSLLWSLDPLDATPEGGVVITVEAEAERGRLEAQLQVLDQLRRPRLLCVPSAHPEALIAALEPGERFEWIVGRSPFQELDEAGLAAWLDCVGKLAAPRAQLRWLQSMPLIGPAGALAELMRQRQRCGPEELATLVQQAAVWESGGLGSGPGADAVQQCLEARGWSVEAEQWREPLSVKLSAGLRQRWFGEGASYGRQLGAALGSDAAERLERLSAELEGAELAQALQHTLLMAMKKAPGNPGPEG